MKIYLAGFLGGAVLDKCIAWRKAICEHYVLKGWDITFLDPINGKLEANTMSADGLKSVIPSNAILHRDYQSVISSDLIIANMDTFGSSRGLCGTLCELAWAWERHIPIVMITNEERYIEHPFTKYFASMIVGSVEELLEKKCINYFYSGTHSAKY